MQSIYSVPTPALEAGDTEVTKTLSNPGGTLGLPEES